MKNHQINSETSDVPNPDLSVSALTADESEGPKSIMLIASTDAIFINTCVSTFMKHCKGPHGFQCISDEVGEYDPKRYAHYILVNTAEPYSNKFLESMLVCMKAEISDPGIIDREAPDSELDD